MWTGANRLPHNRRRLACAAALSVCFSFVLQCVSLSTKWWVHIHWRFNTTFYLNTDLGLWQKCEITTEVINNRTISQRQSCTYDVLADMVRASDFYNMHILAFCAPIAALGMTITGAFTIMLSSASKRPSSQLTASILFIVTGMSSLTGFIIFIDHASEEIGNQKSEAFRGASRMDTEFEYGYGISLILFGMSVIFSEFSGFAYGAFYLHYYRYKYVRQMPQFAMDEYGEAMARNKLMDHIAVSTSRCLNEHTISAMQARLNAYRAPSRSCTDLSTHLVTSRSFDGNQWHSNFDYAAMRHLVKSSSAFSIKNVRHSQIHDDYMSSNGNLLNPSLNAASATTLYSRVTEV